MTWKTIEQRREYYRKWREQNREKIRIYNKEYRKKYLANPENEKRHRECDKEYQKRKREMGLVDKTEESRKWRLRNPNGANAHQLVNYYIKIGKIKRKNCEFCKEEDVYAHHDNYYKPLEVRWMCHSCHQKYHLGLLADKVLLTN